MCIKPLLIDVSKSWPGIDNINFEKIITNLIPTAKGHLDQERTNLQSTQLGNNDKEDNFGPKDGNSTKTYKNSVKLYAFKPKGKTYSDQTGRFPFRSSHGNEYIIIMYDHNLNAILVTALKNRQAKTIADSWESLHTRLTTHGHQTKKIILDNECSGELKLALKKYKK